MDPLVRSCTSDFKGGGNKMQNKVKNIVVTGVFICFLSFFVIMCGVKFFHPTAYSDSERRPLAQFPEKITWDGVVDKTVIDQFEKYTVDQFPFREFFRTVKTKFQLNVLGLAENNGLAVKDDYIAKIEPEFTDELVEYSVGRLQYVYEKYLKENGGDKFVALVPDKNYFLAEEFGAPMMDYDALYEDMKLGLPQMTYIEIKDLLAIEDYYRNDLHWRQEKILDVARLLGEKMGVKLNKSYSTIELDIPVNSTYYGTLPASVKDEKIAYLNNSYFKKCKAFDYENNKNIEIYSTALAKSEISYDMFLGGALSVITLENPKAETNRELVIFRDSFGSSIAPLFLEGYKKITLLDIRYLNETMVGQFVRFENQDVLFLYNTTVLNNRSSFR